MPRLIAHIGDVSGDVIPEIAKNLATNAGGAFARFRSPAHALERLRKRREEEEGTLIILCTDFAIPSMPKSIQALRSARKNSRLVVIAMQAEESGLFALDCIEAGACDYLVRNSYDHDGLKMRLGQILAEQDQCLGRFPRFAELDGLKAFAVFVATPYSTRWFDDYHNGIKPACDRLEIRCQLARDELYFRLLLDNVAKHIDNNTIVIANISAYGHPPSANVFLEVGYSISAKKKVILVRRKDDLSPLPADIQGLIRVEYLNCADLALQLYFGFGGADGMAQRRKL